MIDEIELSDDWTSIQTDAVVEWVHNERPLSIRVDAYERMLITSIYRMVSADGYEAEIETLHLEFRTVEETAARIVDIADEIDAGIGVVTAIGAEEAEIEDETYVHFYCVFEDLLPDGIDVEQLVFEDDVDTDEDTRVTVSSHDAEGQEGDVRIEIYPVHESEVTRIDG